MSAISDKQNNEEGDLTTKRTCLFTNKPLDENTKIEHTIPRALCGRIRSKTVTCSEFNEASSKCDAILRQEFLMILGALAPMLPKEFDPGEIPVTLDSGIPAIKKGGVIDLQKPHVLERTSNGLPKHVYIPDNPKTLDKNLERFRAKKSKLNYISLPGNQVFYDNLIACSSQSEISILKSIVCTIDFILQKESRALFTRSKEMKPLRDFIKDSISKLPEEINIQVLDRHYLGIQLFDMKVFEKALSFHKYKAKAFEHIILFSSNTATKTLDAAWNIFSHEVHVVRLATRWTGPYICGYIANPIFQKERYSYQILPEENPYFKLQKTPVKGFGCGERPPQNFCDYAVFLRTLAYYDAVRYVETHADHYLTMSFRDSASIFPHLSLYDLLVARLTRLFKESYGKELKEALNLIDNKYTYWKEQPVSVLNGDSEDIVLKFVRDYQNAFSSLATDYYHPSKITNIVTPVIKKIK